jgi:hypothetical protein
MEMSEALINCLDRDEARMAIPPEGPHRTPAGTSSIHRELEKVNFSQSWVPRTAQPLRYGWRTW